MNHDPQRPSDMPDPKTSATPEVGGSELPRAKERVTTRDDAVFTARFNRGEVKSAYDLDE